MRYRRENKKTLARWGNSEKLGENKYDFNACMIDALTNLAAAESFLSEPPKFDEKNNVALLNDPIDDGWI